MKTDTIREMLAYAKIQMDHQKDDIVDFNQFCSYRDFFFKCFVVLGVIRIIIVFCYFGDTEAEIIIKEPLYPATIFCFWFFVLIYMTAYYKVVKIVRLIELRNKLIDALLEEIHEKNNQLQIYINNLKNS